MKSGLIFSSLALILIACNDNGSSVENKLDSLEERIDTTAEKIWDSTKAKAKNLKEEIEEEWKERKNTPESKNNDSIIRD